MAFINVVVATRPAVFSFGTEPTFFEYFLGDANGATIAKGESPSPSYTFPDVGPGNYIITVIRNGVPAHATVTVPGEDVTIEVPDVITVTIG